MLWFKRPSPVHEKSRAAGVDLTSSRVRALAVAAGKVRPLALDEAAEELPLVIALDRRSPEVGRVGHAICRKTPHAVCSNFLAALGESREWRNGRHALNPESALDVVLNKLRKPLAAEAESVALSLPPYLVPTQVAKVVATVGRAKIPLKGTAAAPLALAADRAAAVLTGKPAAPEVRTADWVVPLRPAAGGTGAVAVIDADEFALSASIVYVERDRVRLLAAHCWPRLGVRVWKERLLDGVSDRCVRLCRRDPRDSAEAEQMLFDQLDDAQDHARTGQRVGLTVRTDRWYQDVILQPDEFDGFCAALARTAAESVRDLVAVDGAGLPLPPRAVWLTHDAGRLPGLTRAVHLNTPEGTAVEVLPPDAASRAAAALVPRWLSAELPRAHLDTTIPLPAVVQQAAEKPAKGRR